jgi:hypothetical protein
MVSDAIRKRSLYVNCTSPATGPAQLSAVGKNPSYSMLPLMEGAVSVVM